MKQINVPLRKRLFVDQDFSQRNPLRKIDPKNGDGCPTDLGPPDEFRPFPAKMPSPPLSARVEQANDLSRDRIDAAQIRAFVEVAVVAGQGKVISEVAAPVLFGDDVFDVETRKRIVVLEQATILATILRPLPNQLPQRLIHQEPLCFLSKARALDCKMAMKLLAQT